MDSSVFPKSTMKLRFFRNFNPRITDGSQWGTTTNSSCFFMGPRCNFRWTIPLVVTGWPSTDRNSPQNSSTTSSSLSDSNVLESTASTPAPVSNNVHLFPSILKDTAVTTRTVNHTHSVHYLFLSIARPALSTICAAFSLVNFPCI